MNSLACLTIASIIVFWITAPVGPMLKKLFMISLTRLLPSFKSVLESKVTTLHIPSVFLFFP